jgi:hypothetical protein
MQVGSGVASGAVLWIRTCAAPARTVALVAVDRVQHIQAGINLAGRIAGFILKVETAGWAGQAVCIQFPIASLTRGVA